MTIATTLDRDTAVGLSSGLVGRATAGPSARSRRSQSQQSQPSQQSHPVNPVNQVNRVNRVQDVTARLGASAEVAQHRLRTVAEDRMQQLQRPGQSYAAIWIAVVLIGIFIIGAAALAIYCIRHGRNGAVLDYRTQTIKKFRIPVGIRVSIHCV